MERGPVLPPLVVLDMSDPANAIASTSAPSLGAPIVQSDEYDAYAQVADYSAVDYSVVDDGAMGGAASAAQALDSWAGPKSVAEMVAPTPTLQLAPIVEPVSTPSESEGLVGGPSFSGLGDEPRPVTFGEAPPAPSLGPWKDRLDIGRLLALRDRLLAFLEGAAATDASANGASLPPTSAEPLLPTPVETSTPMASAATTSTPTTSTPTGTTMPGPTPTTVSSGAGATVPADALHVEADPSRVEAEVTGGAPGPRVRVESERDRLAMVPSPPPPPKAIGEQGSIRVAAARMWLQHPAALVHQLEAAGDGSQVAAWKASALSLVEELSRTSPDDQSAARALQELSDLAMQGFHGALKLTDPVAQRTWLRSSRALSRRLPLWRAIVDPGQRQAALAPTAPESEEIRRQLAEVEKRLTDSASAADWRAYLQLQLLADLTSVGGADPERARRAAARETLRRMAADDLTSEQRQFVADVPCSALAIALRTWASGTVDLQKLAAILERYESERAPHDGVTIAEAVQRLRYSDSPQLQELSRELDSHYRNANVRLAASNAMFNRLLPQGQSEVAPVHDRLAGADVHGRSKTDTQLQFRLHPDPNQWLLELEARGKVHSRTYSDAWPTRLRNAGKLEFQARKMIHVSRNGVDATPAVARARGSSSLVGVDTKLDPLPIVSDLFKGMARSRHRERQPAANAQAKSKVAEKARQRLDQETETRLERLDEQFRATVLVPLQELAVIAEPLDMHSTEQRAVMRVRMADVEQLAANTPRPVAPSDSLVSVQLHESALNNVAAGLGLDGAKMTVHDLYRLLATRLRLVSTEPPDDLPGKAVIQFAEEDAVSIRCDGDRIRLTLGIAELARGRDSIRNVKVHAYFQPTINGLAAQLVRDGALEFDGPSLRTGTRMVLHGVFNRLIPKDQPLDLVAARLKDDPRWADLMVTQLVIEDGWVALALGPAHPQRTAWRTGGGLLVR